MSLSQCVCVCVSGGRQLGNFLLRCVSHCTLHSVEEAVMHAGEINVVCALDWLWRWRKLLSRCIYGIPKHSSGLLWAGLPWAAVLTQAKIHFSVTDTRVLLCSRHREAGDKEVPQHPSLREHICGRNHDLRQSLNLWRKSQPSNSEANSKPYLLNSLGFNCTLRSSLCHVSVLTRPSQDQSSVFFLFFLFC